MWYLESWFTRNWQLAPRLHLSLRRSTPDLVVAVHPYTLPLAGTYAARAGIPHWGYLHGFEAWAEWPDSLNQAIQSCATLLAVSRCTADSLERRLTRTNPPVRVLHPTVDATRFVATPSPLKPTDLCLLTVTHLSIHDRYKGYDRVMACLPALQTELGPPVLYCAVTRRADGSWTGEGFRIVCIEAAACGRNDRATGARTARSTP